MPDGLVIKPFTAHLVLDDVERRLEAGERVSAEELSHWGRSVDHLVNNGQLAIVNEVAAADASIETLVNRVVAKADELTGPSVAKLHAVLPAAETDDEGLFETIREHVGEFAAELEAHAINLLEHSSDEALLTEVGRRGLSTPEAVTAEGGNASGADGDPGGVGADASESQPSASDPTNQTDEPAGDVAPAGEDETPAVETPATETEPDQPAA